MGDDVLAAGQTQASHLSADIVVQFTGITQGSRQQLEQQLTTWARWHAESYQQGYSAADITYKGTLQLDMSRLFKDKVVIWKDTVMQMHQDAATLQAHNSIYHQENVVPSYERASTYSLSTASTGEDKLLQQLSLGTPDANGGGSSSGSALKRRRVSGARCFNCGSYAHGASACPKPFDAEAHKAGRAEQAAWRQASGGRNKRYYEGEGGRDGKQVWMDSTPGVLCEATATALGMDSPDEPPPWLYNMIQLGYPPAYRATVGAGADTGPESPLLVVVDDMNEEDDQVVLETPPPTSNAAGSEIATPTVLLPGLNGPLPDGKRAARRWRDVITAAQLESSSRAPTHAAGVHPSGSALQNGGGGGAGAKARELDGAATSPRASGSRKRRRFEEAPPPGVQPPRQQWSRTDLPAQQQYQGQVLAHPSEGPGLQQQQQHQMQQMQQQQMQMMPPGHPPHFQLAPPAPLQPQPPQPPLQQQQQLLLPMHGQPHYQLHESHLPPEQLQQHYGEHQSLPQQPAQFQPSPPALPPPSSLPYPSSVSSQQHPWSNAFGGPNIAASSVNSHTCGLPNFDTQGSVGSWPLQGMNSGPFVFGQQQGLAQQPPPPSFDNRST